MAARCPFARRGRTIDAAISVPRHDFYPNRQSATPLADPQPPIHLSTRNDGYADNLVARTPAYPHLSSAMFKLISWNLLRLTGASLDDVVRLIRREDPDLLLMQEATREMDGLTKRVGGQYQRNLMPGRVHGLAVWSPVPLPNTPVVLPLQAGAMFHRLCQIVDLGSITIANVHLSHGQILNRRQLRRIAKVLPSPGRRGRRLQPDRASLLPGFRDVGPREPTHVAGEFVPLRIDRCLIRGVALPGSQSPRAGGIGPSPDCGQPRHGRAQSGGAVAAIRGLAGRCRLRSALDCAGAVASIDDIRSSIADLGAWLENAQIGAADDRCLAAGADRYPPETTLMRDAGPRRSHAGRNPIVEIATISAAIEWRIPCQRQ